MQARLLDLDRLQDPAREEHMLEPASHKLAAMLSAAAGPDDGVRCMGLPTVSCSKLIACWRLCMGLCATAAAGEPKPFSGTVPRLCEVGDAGSSLAIFGLLKSIHPSNARSFPGPGSSLLWVSGTFPPICWVVLLCTEIG